MAPGATENGAAALMAVVSAMALAQKAPMAGGASQSLTDKVGTTDGATKPEDNGVPGDDTKDVEEVAKPGMECDIKNLYQKEDDRGRTTWTDKYPDGLDEAAENEATARYAILVRNKKSFDPRKKLEIDSIVVQSPLLKSVLSKVLKDYPGKFKYLTLRGVF